LINEIHLTVSADAELPHVPSQDCPIRYRCESTNSSRPGKVERDYANYILEDGWTVNRNFGT
jgi:hypothetical protein